MVLTTKQWSQPRRCFYRPCSVPCPLSPNPPWSFCGIDVINMLLSPFFIFLFPAHLIFFVLSFCVVPALCPTSPALSLPSLRYINVLGSQNRHSYPLPAVMYIVIFFAGRVERFLPSSTLVFVVPRFRIKTTIIELDDVLADINEEVEERQVRIYKEMVRIFRRPTISVRIFLFCFSTGSHVDDGLVLRICSVIIWCHFEGLNSFCITYVGFSFCFYPTYIPGTSITA